LKLTVAASGPVMTNQSVNPAFTPISVKELANSLAAPEGLQLIDVREPQEVAIAKIAGFDNLPLSEYANWSEQIQTRFDPHAETIVLCHHGMRSAQMCQWLASQGFTKVKNVEGGIEAYSVVVDPSIPRY
jgi:rhodanese-related sulfurtransferase